MERGRLISKVITLDEGCLFSKFTLKITYVSHNTENMRFLTNEAGHFFVQDHLHIFSMDLSRGLCWA